MDDVYDQEQQEIAEALPAPRETNPTIYDTSNEEEKESDDTSNEEEEEEEEESDNIKNRDGEESENTMIEEAEVQATRHSTCNRSTVEWLIEQDDLHTVGKKSNF